MILRGLALLFMFVFAACASDRARPPKVDIPRSVTGYPSPRFEVIAHTGFVLGYNEAHEQAAWVQYELTRAEVQSEQASRKDQDWAADRAVLSGSASKDDYRNSGYDKGHLAPAGDMKWSAAAMRDCFLLSNASPQLHEMNAGVWNDLEQATREIAAREGSLTVVTGPVLKSGLKTIGPDKVSVPEQFYKILYTASRAIGFLVPNSITYSAFTTYACSVDSVEQVTGLDFLPDLADADEAQIERTFDLSSWLPSR